MLLSAVLVITVAFRWVRYGYKLLCSAMWEHMAAMWNLLDVLSPSETQEIRIEKQHEVWKTVRKAMDETQEAVRAYAPWQVLTTTELLVLTICGIVSVVSTYYAVSAFFGSARRVVMRARGVQLESMRAGSAFSRGNTPGYQVAVKKPGFLVDEHLGYGIRHGNWMVVPKHVLVVDGEVLSEIVLVGTKGKVLMNVVLEQSRALDDLVYVHVTEKIWSMLAVAKAKLASEATNQFVTCAGLAGVSNGRLRKTDVRWIMAYSGSTLPGMSGAAYDFKNQVQGIHTGAAGGFNLGISSALIVAETRMLVRQETPNEGDAAQYEPRFINSDRQFWKQMDAMADLEERYKNNSWADDDDDFDYNQKIDFGEESSRRTKKKKVPSVTLASGGEINIRQQSGDGEDSTMVVLNAEDHSYMRRVREERIIQRVEALEGQSRPVGERYSCTYCGEACRSQEKLSRHVKNSHETPRKPRESVQLESAHPSDTGITGKTVKTGSFLEKRSTSLRNSGATSKRNLISLKKNNRSPHREEFQSAMMDSQRSIESSLKKLLEVMAGQRSETKQN